jgi:hypothetical protein
VFLKSPARIEALLLCHFIAMLVQALVEREIRQAMATEQAGTIPLYPEDRACGAPTAARVLEIFSGLARHGLIEDGQTVRIFQPELSPLQQKVLGLLGISPAVYTGGPA